MPEAGIAPPWPERRSWGRPKLRARIVRIAAAAAALGCALPALGSAASPEAATWESWANTERVGGIALDPATGAVWLATQGGAVRWESALGAYTRYTRPDGLPLSTLSAVAVDTRGAVWFGSAGRGLARLAPDGAWSSILASPEGLASDHVNALAAAPDGALWIATEGSGLSRLAADGSWATFGPPEGLPSTEIQAVHADSQGWVWVATPEGAARGRPEGPWETFTSADGLAGDAVTGIATDGAGNAWFATFDGLSRRAGDGTWTTWLAGELVRAVALEPGGAAWAATADGAVRVAGEAIARYGQADGLPSDTMLSVATDPTGATWLGTDHGLARRDAAGRVSVYCTADPPLDLRVAALALDGEDRPWFGTSEGLAHQDAQGRWQIETRATTGGGLPSGLVQALAFDRAGNLWVGTAMGAARRARDGAWTPFPAGPGTLVQGHVAALAATPAGGMWFGTLGGASHRTADGRWRSVGRASSQGGLPDDRVQALAVDPAGGTWFGTFGGLAHEDDRGAWRSYTVASTGGGLPQDSVLALAPDAAGGIWVGTLAGLAHLDREGRWQTFSVAKTGGGLPHDEVRAILADGAGGFWFATPAGLARRLADGRWQTETQAEGLPDDRVLAMAHAADGTLWVGTSGGTGRRRPALPGPRCDLALPIGPGATWAAAAGPDAPGQVFRLLAPPGPGRLAIDLADPSASWALTLFRDCGAGPVAAAPLGASRGERGERRMVLDPGARAEPLYLRVAPRPRAGGGVYRLRLGWAAPPEGARTLILSHLPRLAELQGLALDGPEIESFSDALDELAAAPELRGIVIRDLERETDPELAESYRAWLAAPGDPARANAVAEGLRHWIAELRGSEPGLRYLVLAGDDRVIPHHRIDLGDAAATVPGWLPESRYLEGGGLDRASPIAAALAANRVLSDDIYGAVPGGAGVPPPDLAVGRLVEGPGEMAAAIEAYLGRGGVLSLGSSYAAGNATGAAAARAVDAALATAGIPAGDRRLDAGPGWTTAELEQGLLEEGRDLVFLALPARHDAFLAPDGDALPAETLARTPGARHGLIIAAGAHAGLNAAGAHPRPIDIAQAVLGRGTSLVAPSGWAYGLAGGLPESAWQAELAAMLTTDLLRSGGGSLGEALVEAKRAYRDRHPNDPAQIKTAAGTVLFGLPMLRVVPPAGPALPGSGDLSARAAPPPDPAALEPIGPEALIERGQSRSFPAAALTEHASPAGPYLRFAGQAPLAEAGGFLLPAAREARWSAELGGRAFAPRGLVLRGARYRDRTAAPPSVVLAPFAALEGLAPPPAPEPGAWSPAFPLQLSARNGPAALRLGDTGAEQIFALGQFRPGPRVERRIESLDFDATYSSASDRKPPELRALRLEPAAGAIRLRAEAADESGIAQVVAAHTRAEGLGPGAWQSVDLAWNAAGDVWEGTIPPGSLALVQLIDRAGNVLIDTRGGRYWACETCPAQPPAKLYLPQLFQKR